MMNTMRRVTLVALLVAVASASSIPQAEAQIFGPNRGRNDRVENIREEFQDYLDRIDREADQFSRALDYDLDRSRLNDKNREDEVNRLAQDIRRYARTAKNKFDRRQKIGDDVRQLIDATNRMDGFLRRTRISFSRDTQRYWTDLSRDIDRLRSVADRANRYNNNGRSYEWWR